MKFSQYDSQIHNMNFFHAAVIPATTAHAIKQVTILPLLNELRNPWNARYAGRVDPA